MFHLKILFGICLLFSIGLASARLRRQPYFVQDDDYSPSEYVTLRANRKTKDLPIRDATSEKFTATTTTRIETTEKVPSTSKPVKTEELTEILEIINADKDTVSNNSTTIIETTEISENLTIPNTSPNPNENKVDKVSAIDFLYDGDDDGDVVSPQSPQLIGNSEEKIVTLKTGGNITMLCRFRGFPTPKVVWFKGENEASEDLKQELDTTSDPDHSILAQLIISKVGCNDEGKYSCVAGNFVGKIAKEFLLDISQCNV